MKFYIAEPTKTEKKYGTLYSKLEGLEIWKFHGKLLLYKGEYLLGSLYSGSEGLRKYYKSDYRYWVKKLKEKDMKKIKKMKDGIKGVLKACKFIEKLWEK